MNKSASPKGVKVTKFKHVIDKNYSELSNSAETIDQHSASGVQCGDDAELLERGSSVVQESLVVLQVPYLNKDSWKRSHRWDTPSKPQKNCDLLTMDVLQTNTIAAIWLPYGSYMAIIWLLYVIKSKNHVGFVVIHPILGIQMKWVCNWLLMTFPQYVYTNQVWPWHILWLQWHTMAKYMFMFCVRKTNLIENLNARTSRVKFA